MNPMNLLDGLDLHNYFSLDTKVKAITGIDRDSFVTQW